MNLVVPLLFVFFVLIHVLTRKQGEDWLRQEGYLPPTPEQSRREAMEENLQKLMKGGDPIL